MRGSGIVDGYAANLLQGINSWLQLLNEQRVSHILCEGNSLADFMAVGGAKRLAAEYIMSNQPSELYTLLKLDGKNYETQRKRR